MYTKMKDGGNRAIQTPTISNKDFFKKDLISH